MSIYTKTGDAGETGLYTGERVKKSSLRVAVYGTVDELDSVLGLARAFAAKAEVRERVLALQKKLPMLMADLASRAQKASIAEAMPPIRIRTRAPFMRRSPAASCTAAAVSAVAQNACSASCGIGARPSLASSSSAASAAATTDCWGRVIIGRLRRSCAMRRIRRSATN